MTKYNRTATATATTTATAPAPIIDRAAVLAHCEALENVAARSALTAAIGWGLYQPTKDELADLFTDLNPDAARQRRTRAKVAADRWTEATKAAPQVMGAATNSALAAVGDDAMTAAVVTTAALMTGFVIASGKDLADWLECLVDAAEAAAAEAKAAAAAAAAAPDDAEAAAAAAEAAKVAEAGPDAVTMGKARKARAQRRASAKAPTATGKQTGAAPESLTPVSGAAPESLTPVSGAADVADASAVTLAAIQAAYDAAAQEPTPAAAARRMAELWAASAGVALPN